MAKSCEAVARLRAAEEIDALYPKPVGSPEARLQWIVAAIKRDGADRVRGGTIAFANACKECGLCRRHEDWGGVPYPQKFFGKKYAYYLVSPYDHLCISKNRVRRTVQPGISTLPETEEDRRISEAITERNRQDILKKRAARKAAKDA